MNRGRKGEFCSIWLLLLFFCAMAVMVFGLCYHFSSRLPDNIGRKLTAEEEREVIQRNSSLISYIYLSPNADFPRKDKIKKLTIHHMAGNLSLEEVGKTFSQRDRRASSNYAIDSTGRVALYVEESNRAWTSRSRKNDNQAVTIEVANDELGGNWHVSDEAYETLIILCADVCRRNDITELRFTGDAEGNLTLHKMFYSGTECPGPYLEGRMEEIAAAVNQLLEEQ
ncbi:peptidoglycan recognition family protein [Lachnospiraceae bacterium 62-35]